jgi:hypothetical protein
MGLCGSSSNVGAVAFLIQYIRQLPRKLKLMGGDAAIYGHPSLSFFHNF